MELQLASKLGVSRTPIREAIRMLEQEGLAVTMPRKGAEVAKMTLKDMGDVLEIREALEELAVREKITDEQLKRLMDAKDLFETSTRTGDVKKIAEADVRFHDVIYEATGNPKLETLLNNLREQVYRYRVEYIKDPMNYPVLIREHEAILLALKERNVKKAESAMHEHVANQAAAVKNVIQQQE